ncbi:MAG: peptidylprolyl isomerase [Planctomycetaceae bacterium]
MKLVLPIYALTILIAARGFALDAHAQNKSTRSNNAAAGKTLVTVNGTPLTAASVELWMIMHAIPPSQRGALQEQAAQRLVEEELVAQFLRSRKVDVPETEVDKMIRRWEMLVAKEKLDPAEMRMRLGISDSAFRETLSLMPRWEAYLQEIVTRDKLNEFFEAHRQEFDGTRVRVSQILKKLPPDAAEKEVDAANAELAKLKADIESGSITFAEAAMQHSDAPSKSKGGDVGSFTFRGAMAKEITQTAFRLQPGELSEPFRSPFGMHIIVVNDRQPGQLSLEDVRAQVLEELGQNLWSETVARLQEDADIKWTAKPGK